MSKFKIGDRVKKINDGKIGTVVEVSNRGVVGVSFDDKNFGIKMRKDDDSGYYIGLYLYECEYELISLPSTVTIEIDPTDPKQAHAAVNEAIETHRKKQREWTADEIEQARTLSHELLCKWFDMGYTVVFYVSENQVYADCSFGTNPHPRKYFANPISDDTFNETIGKCVCLCKITGTPVPDFIRNKNK